MQNGISSALVKPEASAKAGPQSPLAGGPADSQAQAATPFNILLGTAQKAVSLDDVDLVDSSENDQLSADIDIFSDSLTDLGFSGKNTQISGEELPLVDENAGDASLLQEGEESEVLVAWQQSQIDWARKSTLPGASPLANSGAEVKTTPLKLQIPTEKSMDLDAQPAEEGGEVLSPPQVKADKKADTQLTANLASSTASDVSKSSSSFASAMQLNSVAAAVPGVKAASQSLELITEAEAGLEFSASSQLKASDNAAPKAPVTFAVTQNALTDPAWTQAMSARISWMAGSGVHTATMQLHPAELGSIHVQLSVDGDSTSVQIQAQNKDTSELVEKMMPRLHSGMENQGLKLEEVKVTHNPNLNDGSATNSGQQFAGQSADERANANNSGRANTTQNGVDTNSATDEQGSTANITVNSGGVDYYA
jgi:flagellar hook-length control protein FliK